MSTLWQWLIRCVIGLGVLFAVLSAFLVVGMNRPNVKQSKGYVSRTPVVVAVTLSQSLPIAAQDIRYCTASVGMGGRLLVYRFSAPVVDLHEHAENEFAAHWGRPHLKKTPDSPSPITVHEIALYQSGFGIDAIWMLPPPDAVGTLYESADGQFSHRPTIFVDETNGVLYFQMTD